MFELPPVTPQCFPVVLRWKLLSGTKFAILGNDVARWLNIVTIPGAQQAQPLFGKFKITKMKLYTIDSGSAAIVWNSSSAAGGFMLPPPTFTSRVSSSSSYSVSTHVPPVGCLAEGWFAPSIVGTTQVCYVDNGGSNDSYLEVHGVGWPRNPLEDLTEPAPGAPWIYTTATPSSIGVTGTLACGPPASTVATISEPQLYIMIY